MIRYSKADMEAAAIRVCCHEDTPSVRRLFRYGRMRRGASEHAKSLRDARVLFAVCAARHTYLSTTEVGMIFDVAHTVANDWMQTTSPDVEAQYARMIELMTPLNG